MDQTSFGNTHAYYGDSTQLLYLRSRYYASGTGRFLSKDPSALERNLYLYARSNSINYSDPSGYFSQSEVYGSFFAVPGTWSSFLDLWGKIEHPKWGFLAALLDAKPGDRLETYRYNITNLKPGLEKVSDVLLDSNTRSSGGLLVKNITASGTNLVDFFRDSVYFGNVKFLGINVASWRGLDTRYYVLHHKEGGLKAYVDGSSQTDYPDYKIYPLGTSDMLKALNGLKPFLNGTVKCGFSASGSMIVDRYGYKYLAVTGSYGIGFSFGTYGEGYVSNGLPNKIANPQSLQQNILGFGFGVTGAMGTGATGSTGWQFWNQGSPKSIAYLIGAQIGGSFDVFDVFPYPFSPNPDASMGWQWPLDIEAPPGGVNTYFRNDF